MYVTLHAREWWAERIFYIVLILCAFALPLSTTATDILFPLAGGLSLLTASWRDKYRALSNHPVALILILFFLVTLAGAIHTQAPYPSVVHRLLQSSCLVIAALLMISIKHGRVREQIISAFLLAMAITLVLSYLQFYVLWPHNYRFFFDSSSIFKNHITQNYLVAIAVFLCFERLLKTPHKKLVYGLFIFLLTYNIFFMSTGRSGYFIYAALALFTGFFYYRWRGLTIAFSILVLLVGSAYFLAPGFKPRIHAIKNNTVLYQQGQDNSAVGVRIKSMKNAYILFTKSPWIGYGTGSFKTAYANLPTTIQGQSGVLPLSYNNYLNVAVELGIFGLGILLFMFYMQWHYTHSLERNSQYLLRMLLISVYIGCLANPWLSDTTELHLYSLFLALGFSTWSMPFRLQPSTNKTIPASQSHSLP